jgi:hypothetical protein
MLNRTIKFRFWNPQAKAFVEQYKYSGYVDELFEEDKFLIPSQFTELQDIKGNYLFEGDIVKFHDDKIGYVDFEFGSFLLRIKNPSTSMGFIFLHAVGQFEIIGNKFDNPELLE